MSKYLTICFRKYIFIILTTVIILLTSTSKSFSEKNVFTIDNVIVKGKANANFSRDKYINEAFSNSFEMLMSKIILTRDFTKIKNVKLNKIRNLIKSFQIIDETYQKNEYKGIFEITYSDVKVKKLLRQNNISFSQPKNISVVFFPVLFVNEDLQAFDENFFYREWTKLKIDNELINFILPIEDLDDISKIKEMKNVIEKLEVDDLVRKYNTSNYVFTLMDYQNKQLNVYLETNFNNNKMSKNISYELDNINDEVKLNSILKTLKIKTTDIWKEENIINLVMPLSLRVKFQYKNPRDLDKLKNTFYKINIIYDYALEEFNIHHAYFTINYYGNPSKLKSELLKFDYQLKNIQGHWELHINE